MTSVTGPAEVKARKEQIDKATIGVLSKPPTGQPSLNLTKLLNDTEKSFCFFKK